MDWVEKEPFITGITIKGKNLNNLNYLKFYNLNENTETFTCSEIKIKRFVFKFGQFQILGKVLGNKTKTIGKIEEVISKNQLYSTFHFKL